MRRVNAPDAEVAAIAAYVRERANLITPSSDLRTAFRVLLPELIARFPRNGAAAIDPIGRAYEFLIAPSVRRLSGQFFTPDWAAAVMANWVLKEPTRLL